MSIKLTMTCILMLIETIIMYILYRLYRVLNNGCYVCEKIMKYIDKIFHFTTQYNAKLPDAYGAEFTSISRIHIALYFI